MGLSPVTGGLTGRDNRETGTNKREPCEEGNRDWNDTSTSQGTPRSVSSSQKLGSGVDGSSPGSFRGTMALLTP